MSLSRRAGDARPVKTGYGSDARLLSSAAQLGALKKREITYARQENQLILNRCCSDEHTHTLTNTVASCLLVRLS